MFLFGALTHFGQEASVTFAQEKAVIIANLSEEGLGGPWSCSGEQVRHGRGWCRRLFQVGACTASLCAPGSHKELDHCCPQQQGWLHRNHLVPVSPSYAEV